MGGSTDRGRAKTGGLRGEKLDELAETRSSSEKEK